MLTPKQYRLLNLIDEKVKATGIPPSFEEMKNILGLRSKSGIHRLISSLEERGFIRRLPYKARALEVIKMPGEAASLEQEDSKKTQNNKKAYDMPFLGNITKNAIINMLKEKNTITVPKNMVGKGEHYALKVNDDNMINAGILSGDTVIIKKVSDAKSGSIVVALLNDANLVLSKFTKQNNKIYLENNNKNQAYEDKQVEIKGQLVGLIRNY